jgi:selenocysteine lyase/cysteine desulfurase
MPPTATLMYARSLDLVHSTRHIVPSWGCGKGLGVESRFVGTRDYSVMLAVPVAVRFLQDWRSDRGESAAEYCHRLACEAARQLSRAWGTDAAWPCASELVATQCMVRLPFDSVDDCPGRPASAQSLRTVLRDEHKVEAAVGHFEGVGTFVRLSFAVYNTLRDIDRLERAVLLEATRRRGAAGDAR